MPGLVADPNLEPSRCAGSSRKRCTPPHPRARFLIASRIRQSCASLSPPWTSCTTSWSPLLFSPPNLRRRLRFGDQSSGCTHERGRARRGGDRASEGSRGVGDGALHPGRGGFRTDVGSVDVKTQWLLALTTAGGATDNRLQVPNDQLQDGVRDYRCDAQPPRVHPGHGDWGRGASCGRVQPQGAQRLPLAFRSCPSPWPGLSSRPVSSSTECTARCRASPFSLRVLFLFVVNVFRVGVGRERNSGGLGTRAADSAAQPTRPQGQSVALPPRRHPGEHISGPRSLGLFCLYTRSFLPVY